MIYKVLPMWQPFAQLVVLGEKKYETRSRDTNIRGTILIHACLIQTDALWNSYRFSPFREALEAHGLKNGSLLPLGCIIGAVDVIGSYQIHHFFAGQALIYETTERGFINKIIKSPEHLFGDYTPGRYAWKLENPREMVEPIPYKGTQGWGKFETDQPLIFK
jgi:hypothetical protein